jgi:arylsulfatase A-like enzyme
LDVVFEVLVDFLILGCFMKSKINIQTIIRQIILASLFFSMTAFSQNVEKKANILIILADDMGFSDIGCYGGEIKTPHLDNLAENGLRFTQFYNTAKCSPTRASLLTGLYQHQAGMGKLASSTNQGHGPYQGYLNDQCVTIPEVLRPAGYRTLMSGKWHVGQERPNWPVDRGFDRYFGLINGAGSFWESANGMTMALDDQLWEADPEVEDSGNFYMTDAITDSALNFLNQHDRQYADQPFFMYLAYTAPHWPLHAPQEDIDKYKDRYKDGWDVLREERYQRMKRMGLITDKWQLSSRESSEWEDSELPAWDSLDDDEKQYQSEIMAVYAAMIDRMDQNIGRIVEKLKNDGQLDNTLVLFLSDNGACSVGTNWAAKNGLELDPDAPLGSRRTFAATGQSWANASNTPLRYYKSYNHEGGISTPLIAHWPKGITDSNTFVDQPGHAIDIMATCLEIAGVQYPQQFNGNDITPLEGKSLLPIFKGQQTEEHEAIFFEFKGSCGMLKGKWKISLHVDTQKWELYNLAEDRSELIDRADVYPDRLNEMGNEWLQWAEKVGVDIQDYMRILPTSLKTGETLNKVRSFELYPNYPNPFNPDTKISFHLPVSSNISLVIYNAKGQEVAVLFNGLVAQGKHKVIWNGLDMNNKEAASGIYFARLETKMSKETRKLILLR